MLKQFQKIGEEALAELEQVEDSASMEQFRIKYLGRKGQIIQMLSQIGVLPPEQKPQAGQLANQIKKKVTEAFEQKNAALAAENTLEEKRREKSRLESELNQKRKELQDAKNELELVKQRLAE